MAAAIPDQLARSLPPGIKSMHPLLCALVVTHSVPTNFALLAGSSKDEPIPTLASVFAASQNAPAVEEPKKEAAKDGVDMRVYWKDGFRMETADKAFSMRISGRFQYDSAWFTADETEFQPVTGDLNDGAEIRRAYLGFDGKLFKDWEWKLEWDLAKSGNDFADAYLGRPICIGNLRAGHFKQPQGLEELTSDVNTTFMERSLSGAFKLGRDVGVQLSDTFSSESGNWAVGVFRDSNGNGLSSSTTSDDEYAFTGRATYAPIYADGGKRLVHVGLSASARNPSTNDVSFSAKPEANLAPSFLDTGVIVDGDDYQQYGLEAAAVFGSLSLQGELMQADVDGTSAGGSDPKLDGFYVYASYFLTGESRPYKRVGGVFDRIKPNRNCEAGGGNGAWELGLRYSSLDFSEATAADQTMDDITAGVNWYPNAFTKVQLNVIQSQLERGALDEDAIITMLRFQFDI